MQTQDVVKPSIYGLTFNELEDFFVKNGQKKSQAKRVWKALYQEHIRNFADMKSLDSECIQFIEEHFTIQSIRTEICQKSKDGTVKFLYRLQDGNLIETVLMRQSYGTSVCVTTQVGCNIGCSFCASGLLRKNRDLTAGEIVEQIIHAQQYLNSENQGERITHAVVMGIGEPFDNYNNLVQFLNIITSPRGLNLGPRHITVSTSGIVPKIYDFAHLEPRVNLAISLHAPNNELRTRMMKINRAYPIDKLMAAVDYYIDKTNRRVTFEYIMIKDVNDGVEQAEELAELLKDMKKHAYVNLIPYNPVNEYSEYQRSPKESILKFYDVLKKNGINCTIRQELGSDIDAACGQLRSKQIYIRNKKMVNRSV